MTSDPSTSHRGAAKPYAAIGLSPGALSAGLFAASLVTAMLATAGPASAAGAVAAAPHPGSGGGRASFAGGHSFGGGPKGAWHPGSGPRGMWNPGNRNHEAWMGRRSHGRFWAERRYGQGFVGTGWTAFAPGWGAFDSYDEAPVALDAVIPRLRLPTAEDLPVAGQVRSPVGEPVLYTIRDLSHGRSGRLSGARIVSASKPRPLPGSSPSGDPVRGGPLIIHLTAR